MSALFWTAVINGFLAPPLLIVIMLIANNKAIMGERVIGLGMNIMGWLTAAVMFAAAIGLTGQRPDLVVRFGRGPPLPSSLRRPVQAVLV